MKRILAMAISVILVASMAITGSIAYLQDTDGQINTMVMGNVAITQNEQQRVIKDGEFSAELEDYEQMKWLYPVTYDDKKTADEVTIGNFDITLSDKENNYVDKIVSVTNDGNTDTYVRTLVAIPTGGEAWQPTPVAAADCWLHWNIPADYAKYWTLHSTDVPMITVDEVNYYVWEFVHKEALAAGDTTYPMVRGFYLDQRVGNDDEGYFITYTNTADGVTTTETKRIANFQNKYNCVDILVLSQAIQAAGFTDAQTALDEGFGDVNKANAEAWFAGVEAPVVKKVETADGLKNALSEAATAGETNVLIDANGANIGALNSGLTKAGVPAGTTVTIYNAEIEGKSYGNGVDGTVIFENCTFTNTGAYSIHFDKGSGSVIFNNCVLSGWCSFGSTITSVEMNNCTINGNGTYAMCRFYQDTTLTNCNIDCRNANGEDIYTDGISAVNGATVTLNNCNVVEGTVYETAEGAKIIVDGETVPEDIEQTV